MTAELRKAVLERLRIIFPPLIPSAAANRTNAADTADNACRADAAGGDIVSLGLVSDIFIADKQVFFAITAPPRQAELWENLRRQAEKSVAAITGISRVFVTLTAEKQAEGKKPPQAAASLVPPVRKPAASSLSAAQRNFSAASERGNAAASANADKMPIKQALEGVKHIIAVASGKGGVGKSATAVNLALAFCRKGLKTGLLDADIYGPSLAKMTGITKTKGADIIHFHDKKLIPLQRGSLKMMSMSFLTEEGAPLVWRGPMAAAALRQMLGGTAWTPLDILVADMPPGTGDAPLTLVQSVPLSGAVIVSTPQELALIDARKSIEMFAKIDVPILGLVENMSYFIAPDSGKCYHIFGESGVEAEAKRRNAPFLGAVPIMPLFGRAADRGAVFSYTENNEDDAARGLTEIYDKMAAEIIRGLNLQKSGR